MHVNQIQERISYTWSIFVYTAFKSVGEAVGAFRQEPFIKLKVLVFWNQLFKGFQKTSKWSIG